MNAPRICLAVLVGLLIVSSVPAAAPPPGPTQGQVARWIEELGDDSFAVREAAMKKLRGAGASAESALQAAVRNTDPEISRRAKTLLEQYRWGIYPDTPEKVVKLIRSYQTAARSEKRDLIRKLLAAGPHGCKALAKIARYEEDPQVRKEVFTDIAASIGKVVPVLIEEGNRPALEGLLEVALNGDVRTGAPNYAAYYLLMNQLPERIREWEARAKKAVVAKAENEVLAYLYRANGDLVRARKAASEAERTDLLEGFLYEAADWNALAAKPELIEAEPWPRKAGYQAAFARLSGDKKAADSFLAEIKKRADPVALAVQGAAVMPYAKALFINGRGADGVELLEKGDSWLRPSYDILVAQNKFKEAFALADRARKAGHADSLTLEILRARALHQLGEKDKALAIFKKFTADIRGGPDETWITDLVEAEIAVGRLDDAFAIAAKTFTEFRDNHWPALLFDPLFGKRRAEDAVRLRLLLRRIDEKEDEAKVLSRMRSLLGTKATAKEIDALFTSATEKMKGPPTEDLAHEWRILGDIAAAHKQSVKAAKAFREAGTLRAAIRLGDLLADEKQWKQASDQYLAAYRLGLKLTPGERASDEGESLPALALYLSGHALSQAGQAKAGKDRMEQAHLLPLGDVEMRYDLAQAYLRRGQKKAAQREQELLRRLGEAALSESGSYYTGEGLRAAALDALARKDWLKASDGFEQSFLRVLHPEMNFKRAQAYVVVPAYIFYLRARGLVAANRFDEAKIEIARATNCVPGQVDLAMHLVPELDRKNRKSDAKALFQASVEPYREIIKAFPRSSWALNQSGWLSACCRRDLEVGLEHAREAVKLAPTNSAYLDTLAEVLFQLGKKDEAIAAQKKALALAPERIYFKKQLKRLETGDPKAPRPTEEE